MKFHSINVLGGNYSLDINGNKVLKVFLENCDSVIVRGTQTYKLESAIDGKYYKSLSGLYGSPLWKWENGKWVKK